MRLLGIIFLIGSLLWSGGSTGLTAGLSSSPGAGSFAAGSFATGSFAADNPATSISGIENSDTIFFGTGSTEGSSSSPDAGIIQVAERGLRLTGSGRDGNGEAEEQRGEAEISYEEALTILLEQYEEYEERYTGIASVDDIEASGFTVIADQVFGVVLETFGEEELTFLAAIDATYGRMAVFLADACGAIVWKSDQLSFNNIISGRMEQPNQDLAAVSFQDLDGDGLTDIVLIGTCKSQAHGYEGQTYRMGEVLFQGEGSFYRDWRISDKMNRFSMNKSVEMIRAYVTEGQSAEFLYTATTLAELLENGLTVIEEQSRTWTFEKQGELTVVPGVYTMAEYSIFMVYLVNASGDIVWSCQPMGVYDSFYALRGITCKDVDGDGLKDLVVLARYSYENEAEERVVEMSYAIYYQGTTDFVKDVEFTESYQCAENEKLSDLVSAIREYWGWVEEKND